MSLDSPVLSGIAMATNLAWYSVGVVNWHGSFKAGSCWCTAQISYIRGCSFVFIFSCLRCIIKVIVVLLTEYHSVIAKRKKKVAAVLLTF